MKYSKRKEKAAYTPMRRLLNHVKRRAGIIPKRMDVSFVTINNQHYKRIKFIDHFTSQLAYSMLEDLADCKRFPKVLVQHENELWVEYMQGRLLSNMNDSLCPEFASLYADLYTKSPHQVCAKKFLTHIEINLDFLQKINIIDYRQQQKLLSLLGRITPQKIWIGYDYADAILSNFLIERKTNKLFAIDIDSIRQDCLMGTGLAKANTIWMQDNHLDTVINLMKQQKTPNFYKDLQFIKLHFRSEWLKSLFLRNKRKQLETNRNILLELL